MNYTINRIRAQIRRAGAEPEYHVRDESTLSYVTRLTEQWREVQPNKPYVNNSRKKKEEKDDLDTDSHTA